MSASSSIIHVSVVPPIADAQKPESREQLRINDLLVRAAARLESCGANYVKLSLLSFLVDQDKCFPELMAFVDHCNNDGITILLSEVAESPVLLSTENHSAAKFLRERGHRVRPLLRPKQ